MTIIVYDPATDRILVDTLHTIHMNGKLILHYATKIRVTPSGHRYTASGPGDDRMVGLLIDAAFLALAKGELPLLDIDPDYTNVYVRHSDGRAFVPFSYGEKKTILSFWDLPVPLSRAAGSSYFDAFYAEHGSTDVAMALTLRYGHACGGEVESF